MSYKKLTPARAKILLSWLSAIKANVESGEGDFWVGIKQYSDEDIQAALEVLSDMITSRARKFVQEGGGWT